MTDTSVPSGRRDWDQHSKRVVIQALTALLARWGYHLDEVTVATIELGASSRRADLVFITVGGLVVHIEIQQEPDPRMGHRMADYAIRFPVTPPFDTQMRDLVQVVIQVNGPPMPTRYRLGGLVHDFHLLHVPTTPAADLLAMPGMAPFALVGGGVDVVASVVGEIARTTDLDLRAAMATLAFQLAPEIGGIIFEQLRRADMTDVIEVLRTTDFGRWLIAQGHEQGLEQGWRSGAEDVLGVRFPQAPVSSIAATAARLAAEYREHAVRAALGVADLDP